MFKAGTNYTRLGVNVDHVATVRQARRTHEPDPVWAAVMAELGGADAITIHLREDRRHIQDHDLDEINEIMRTHMNLEMAVTDEMIDMANDYGFDAIEVGHLLSCYMEATEKGYTNGGGLAWGDEDAMIETMIRLEKAISRYTGGLFEDEE